MAWGLGAILFLVGGSVIAAAILADDGRMEAPRWIVSAAGAAFPLAGVAVIKGYVLDRGSRLGSQTAPVWLVIGPSGQP